MSFEDLLGRLDPHPARRGREFERICRWYLQTAPEYQSQLSAIWLWDEWPGRWAADAGIDLVAETVTGQLWAIQAKAYDPGYAIKKSDVDSFLSESSRAQFTYRLLIATTDRIGARARRTFEGQEKQAGLRLRSDLQAAELEWPASPDELLPPTPEPKQLRPHQFAAVQDVLKGFRNSSRGQLLMACGTGKTLVGLHVADNVGKPLTLILVPSLSLVEQTLREWTANAPRPFAYLAVCSDESVVEHDSIVASTAELGVPVTTDPEAIARVLRQTDEHTVVMATYQSSECLVQAQQKGAPPSLIW